MDISIASEGSAIDRNLGLKQYESDEKIYGDILKNFHRSNKDTLTRLDQAVDADDKKLAHRIAHSLRGAAGTIGASRLAAAALQLEHLFSAADKSAAHDKETFENHMQSLKSEFAAVFEELEHLAEKKIDAVLTPGVMHREKTIELLDKVAPFLETGDATSLEFIDEINEIFRPAADGFRLFISQMENYDFEDAFETIGNIRSFMGTQTEQQL